MANTATSGFSTLTANAQVNTQSRQQQQQQQGPAIDHDTLKNALAEAMATALTPLTARLNALELRVAATQRVQQQDARPKQDGGRADSNTRDKHLARELRKLGQEGRHTATTEDDTTEGDTSLTTSSSDAATPKRSKKSRRRRGKKYHKSGREMTMENCGKSVAPWPHHEVFRSETGKGATYESLTHSEFVSGFLAQAETEKYAKYSAPMLRYLRELLDDYEDGDGDWHRIRNMHSVFLTKLERRMITWDNDSQIQKLKTRYIHAQRQRGGKSAAPPPQLAKAEPLPIPCQYFQKGECRREDGHNGLAHVCAFCLRDKGRVHKHPESACYSIIGVPRRRTHQF
ncbi:MAG: hypothetical protein GY701_05040 [Sulfitobacter sp.]|nr:hypothetical protein [Sulfitobacter sp.]